MLPFFCSSRLRRAFSLSPPLGRELYHNLHALAGNIIFSLGLLAGIGGSVLYAVKRGARPSTAPGIIRAYAVAFVLLPFNVFSTYYFRAIPAAEALVAAAVVTMSAQATFSAIHGVSLRRTRFRAS